MLNRVFIASSALKRSRELWKLIIINRAWNVQKVEGEPARLFKKVRIYLKADKLARPSGHVWPTTTESPIGQGLSFCRFWARM